MISVITKWSKVYVPYSYMQIKYKSVNVYIKNKKGWDVSVIVSRGTLCLNLFPDNKQTKANEEG